MDGIPDRAVAIGGDELIPAPPGEVPRKEHPRGQQLEARAIEAVQVPAGRDHVERTVGSVEKRGGPLVGQTVGDAVGDESRGQQARQTAALRTEPDGAVAILERHHLGSLGKPLAGSDRPQAAVREARHPRAAADPDRALPFAGGLDRIDEVAGQAFGRGIKEDLPRPARKLAGFSRPSRARVERALLRERRAARTFVRQGRLGEDVDTARAADPEMAGAVDGHRAGAGVRAAELEEPHAAIGAPEDEPLPGRDPQPAIRTEREVQCVGVSGRQLHDAAARSTCRPGIEPDGAHAAHPDDAGPIHDHTIGRRTLEGQRLGDERPRAAIGVGIEARQAELGRHPDRAIGRLGDVGDTRTRETVAGIVVAEGLAIEAGQPGARTDPEKAARIAEERAHRVTSETLRRIEDLERRTLGPGAERQHDSPGGEKASPPEHSNRRAHGTQSSRNPERGRSSSRRLAWRCDSATFG